MSHAEVGAHLLELWGLPHTIVEAVAFHHRPEAAHDPVLDQVVAVAIGDALVARPKVAGQPRHGSSTASASPTGWRRGASWQPRLAHSLTVEVVGSCVANQERNLKMSAPHAAAHFHGAQSSPM